MAQHHRLSITRRKASDACGQLIHLRAPYGAFLRTRTVIGLASVELNQSRPHSPVPVANNVDRDLVQPGALLQVPDPFRRVRDERPVGAQKRVLRDLFGIHPVAGQGVAQRVDAVLVLSHHPLEDALRGFHHPYEEIVQRYQQVAFRTAYVITGSAADAEDAAQEGFIKAYRALGRFRAGADPRPWLLQIVANEARNRVRSTGRRAQLELRLVERFRPGDAAPSPEAAAVASEERKRLLELVKGLTEEDQLVIASRYFLELSGEETAAALGIAEGTVKSRLSRALARLRTRVEEGLNA